MATERSDDTPLTFADQDWSPSADANVVESDSSSDSSPSEASAEGQPPASATDSPATPPDDGVVEARESGPIPLPDHKRILEAERTKRTSIESELTALRQEMQGYGATREEIASAVKLYRGINEADGVAFLDAFYRNLSNSPAAEAVRSWAARVLGGHAGNADAHPKTPAEIRPDFRTEDGAEIASWSVVKQLVDQAVKSTREELDAKYAPVVSEYEARRREASEREAYDGFAKEARDEYEALKDAPHFDRLKPEIRAHLEQTNWKSVQASYLHALKTNWPKLSAAEKGNVIADMQTRAHASVGKPNAASATAAPANVTKLTDNRLTW